MRACWFLLAVLGCYHPSAAVDVPCSSNGTCPDGQVCDLGHAPPVCVASVSDAKLPGDAAPPNDAGGEKLDSGSPQHDAAVDAGSMTDAGAMTDAGSTPPPITFVQVSTVKPAAATTMLGLNQAVTAHDAIIVCLNYPTAAGTLTSLTDSQGNAYNVVVGPISSGGDVHYVAVALNVSGGADTLTVSLSAAPQSGADLFVLEYSGLALANAFDVFAHQSGTATALTSGSATTTAAHELILGYAEASATTAGAGFASRATLSGNLVEDEVATTAGAHTATATTTSSGTWTMIMATFRGQ